MIYEDIVNLNNSNKEYIESLIEHEGDNVKKEILLQSSYKLCNKDNKLLLINKLNNSKTIEINSLNDVIYFFSNKRHFVSNISLFLKYKHILTRYLLNNQYGTYLFAILRRYTAIETIEFKKVDDIKVMLSKALLLKFKVILQIQDTVLVVEHNNNVTIFSDCILVWPNVPNFNFNSLNCKNLIVDNIDFSNCISMPGMFSDCSIMKHITLRNFDTKRVEDMSLFFYNCKSLESIDFGKINTSNVINFSYMFMGCSSLLHLDLNTLNMSCAKNLRGMFKYCSLVKEIIMSDCKSYNLSTIDMEEMFYYCKNLILVDMSNLLYLNQQVMKDNIFVGCNKIIVKGLERSGC